MIRKISTTVLFILLAGCIVLSSYGFSTSSVATKIPEIPSVCDINLSDKLEYQRFGLFYYDGDRDIRVDEDNINIDTTKPMVIYTHGMVYGDGYSFNAGFSDRKMWQNAGYNAFVFRWSSFADDLDPIAIEKKEWSGREGSMYFAYEGEGGKRTIEKDDIPQFSLAEIFGIFYNDFMTKYNIKSPEIRLMGHSMGGQLTIAIGSYIKTMVDCGAMDKKNLFSRITMLDPFLSSKKSEIYVPWLDKTVGANGSAGMAIDAAQGYTQVGIPVEYISSGYADILVDADYKQLLAENTSYLRIESNYITGNIQSIIARRHQVAVDWYNDSFKYNYMDGTVNDLNYAVAASTPSIFVMSQLNGKYAMEADYTNQNGDEKIYSTNLSGNLVSGYAFYDENNNGLRDDTYANMRKGIRVELYAEGEKVASTTTNEGGFYKFELGLVYVNKELEIRVSNIAPTILATGEGYLTLTENGINPNGKSDKFVLHHRKEIKIINIGIK